MNENNLALTKTRIIEGIHPDNIPESIFTSAEPVILKGLVSSWPLVQKGLDSPQNAVQYLQSHYSGKPASIYEGAAEIKGHFFYNETLTRCNFDITKAKLNEFLDKLLCHIDNPSPPSLYIASNDVNQHFPTLKESNNLTFSMPEFANNQPKASIWIGNKTLVSCHYDALSNIACCAVGHRHFTLFPPEQIENLYPGPLEPTPGGQVVSMVDFKNPDYNKYPKFKEAQKHGQLAELSPGDAIYIPTMWWHQVEALNNFNAMVNYWWTLAPSYMGKGQTALLHAFLSIRNQPEQEKAAWKHFFDYYIFSDPKLAGEHLPEEARGVLGTANELQARKLRAEIINKINR